MQASSQYGDLLRQPRQSRALDRAVLPFMLLVSFVMRLPSLYWTSIDWDESLYFLMSRGLLHGDALYLTVWENKPPGIYLIYALSQLAFGSSLFAARIAASISVAVCGTLLYCFGRDVLESRAVGLVAGLLYTAYSVSNVGLAANTELFFTPFVVLGFYLLLGKGGVLKGGKRGSGWLFLAVGIILGCSLQIKYVTVFDLAGMIFLVLFLAWRGGQPVPPTRALRECVLLLLGAILTFLPPLVWFWKIGHLQEYLYANFVANWIHSHDASVSIASVARLMAGQVKTNLLPWCSVLLAPFFVAAYRKSHARCVRDMGVLVAWLAFGLLGVVFTRRINLHNFLQVLPELCLIGSYVSVVGVAAGGVTDRAKRGFLLILIVSLGMFRPLYDSTRATLDPLWAEPGQETKDISAMVASYLKGKIGDEEYLYVVDCDPILYHLLGVKIPTRYVLPPYLIDDHFVRVAGIDPLAELGRIMQLKPSYVVLRDRENGSPFYMRLREYLKEGYSLETTIEGVSLYHRAGNVP